jgi:hypothetical protein
MKVNFIVLRNHDENCQICNLYIAFCFCPYEVYRSNGYGDKKQVKVGENNYKIVDKVGFLQAPTTGFDLA